MQPFDSNLQWVEGLVPPPSTQVQGLGIQDLGGAGQGSMDKPWEHGFEPELSPQSCQLAGCLCLLQDVL